MMTKRTLVLLGCFALLALAACQLPQQRTSSSRTVSSSYTTTSSQSQLPTPDAAQVFEKTEYRVDELRNSKKLVGPMINREGTYWQGEWECGSALRGWLLSDCSWDFQLYAERYGTELAHFVEAVDESGKRFEITQIDSKTNSYYKNGVLTCTETKEVFGVPLSLDYLRAHENTGMRFKFYGNGPSGSMYVPSYYIKGFLAKVDKFSPAPATTTSTTVTTTQQPASMPVYTVIPANTQSNCYQQTYSSQPTYTTSYSSSASQTPTTTVDSGYHYVEGPGESYTIQRTIDRYSIDRTTERGLPSDFSPLSSPFPNPSSAAYSSSYNYQENVTPMVMP